MSLPAADQEKRADGGASCAGDEDSIMRVNLAEGCWTVNAARRGARDRRERRDVNSVYSHLLSLVPLVARVSLG
jgi:hypothetical protein